MERQEESIIRIESVERSPKRPSLDGPLERIRGVRGVHIELEDPPPSLGGPHRRPHDVLPEPGRECIGVAQARETAPGGEQRVLHRILGVGLGPGQDRGHSERARNERLDQRSERVPITRDRCMDERSKSGRRLIQDGLHIQRCDSRAVRFGIR